MTTRESYDMLFEAGVDTVKEWCQTHHKEVELLVHELQLEEKEAALAGRKADALV
jgi:hypothetical protein